MRKIRNRLWAKLIAVLLLVTSAFVFAGSIVGIGILTEQNVYVNDKEQLLERAFENACQRYSVKAMAGYQDDFNMAELSKTNFRYGVIKGAKNGIEDADLTDPDSYVVENFGDAIWNLKRNQLQVHSYSIDENTFIEYRDGWLGYANIYNDVDVVRQVELPLEGYYYLVDTNMLYAVSGNTLYEIEYQEHILEDGSGGSEDEDVDSTSDVDDMSEELPRIIQRVNPADDTVSYSWKNKSQNIQIWRFGEGECMMPLARIKLGDSLGLAGSSYHISDYEIYNMRKGSIVLDQPAKKHYTDYYVVSYVQQPLYSDGDFWNADLFVQADDLIELAYSMRGGVIAIAAISGLLALIAFVFLMYAAGHHENTEGVRALPLDRLPLDVYLSVTACVCMLTLWVVDYWGQYWRYAPWILAAAFMSGLFSLLLMTACSMSIAVNIKLGKWWQNTVCYRLWKLLGRVLKRLSYGLKSLFATIPMLWKVWLSLGILCFLESVVLVFCLGEHDLTFFIMLWFIERVLLVPAAIWFFFKCRQLQQGAGRIAGGELSFRIDTTRMFGELKKHGETLNNIGAGLNRAVDDKIKSERFKTELITNVSHDIKTPLTSIINYVDLLQKEPIDNPKAAEYLEVLSRQSARLKKLIEDLIEASKASTGSLTVEMDKMEAGVMLVQTIGEYEEKLMRGDINLQIKKPEEPIYIHADSRHLWRVFDNLMNNICKYAQPQTRAYVNLERRDADVLITFRNISRYQLNISGEELMERFVRGDASRTTEGNGLGISIAKSLTELMNGRFELVVDGDLFKVILTFPAVNA